MSKIGVVAIISGILMLIGAWLYVMLIKISLPMFIRIAIILVVLGVLMVIIKQFFDRKHEKEETDAYKDL